MTCKWSAWPRGGLEAIEMTPRLQRDIVLIDVHMPRMDGHEATSRVTENWPRPVVLMSADRGPG